MNSEDIITRLKEILEHYSLTSSTFADSIDVQRSSISHLLSGRNKPSLDFIMKVVDNYNDVDLYWLLYGKGNFPKIIDTEPKKERVMPYDLKNKHDKDVMFSPTLFSEKSDQKSKRVKTQNFNLDIEEQKKITSKKLLKIILLYDDDTFEVYNK